MKQKNIIPYLVLVLYAHKDVGISLSLSHVQNGPEVLPGTHALVTIDFLGESKWLGHEFTHMPSFNVKI
jgi:hypothetical protein